MRVGDHVQTRDGSTGIVRAIRNDGMVRVEFTQEGWLWVARSLLSTPPRRTKR